jgi:hypothetical protein
MFLAVIGGLCLVYLIMGVKDLCLGEMKADGTILSRRSEPGRFYWEAFLRILAPALLISALIADWRADLDSLSASWVLIAIVLPLLLRDLGAGRSNFGPLVTREKEPVDYWIRIGIMAVMIALPLADIARRVVITAA